MLSSPHVEYPQHVHDETEGKKIGLERGAGQLFIA